MMQKIEQRAIQNADNNNYDGKVRSASIGSYMLGASEQRTIDINKACQWLKSMLITQNASDAFIEEALYRLTKEMEG